MISMMYSAVVVETYSDVMFKYHIKDKVPYYRSTVFVNVLERIKFMNPKLAGSSIIGLHAQ